MGSGKSAILGDHSVEKLSASLNFIIGALLGLKESFSSNGIKIKPGCATRGKHVTSSQPRFMDVYPEMSCPSGC